MTYLTTAFYSLFTAAPGGVHNDFYNALAGRLYENEAPAGIEFPYAVYQIISSVKEKTFFEVYKNTILQLSIFSTAEDSGEVKAAYGYASALYDECALSITSSKLVWMKEINLMTMRDEITTPEGTAKIWHYAIDFEIKTSLD